MTIRRQPTDFRVIEQLHGDARARIAPARSSSTPHAVYLLDKTSKTTPEAAAMLAGALGTRSGQVAYAGLKDKHASTSQHVSIPLDSSARARPEVLLPGLTARLLGWIDAPLSSEHITGNRFEIVIRDLSQEAARQIAHRADRLRPTPDADELLIVNYFGAQRFGSARHGEGFVALPLIRGDFEQALKLTIATPARKDSGKTRQFTRLCASKWGSWPELAHTLPRCPERRAIESLATDVQAGRSPDFRAAFAQLPPFTQQMCVEAFQSLLWNACARRLAEFIATEVTKHAVANALQARGENAPTRFKPPEPLSADDDYGLMVFPPAPFIDPRWTELVIPLLGPKTALVAPWGQAAAETLAEHGIAAGDLRIPGLRRPFFGEADRPLFVRATRFAMSPIEPDELSRPGRQKRSLAFDLPRGAYATVVLRSLGQ